MNVYSLFERTLEIAVDRPALITGVGSTREVVTFGELDRRVAAVQSAFTAQGLRPGDRVLLAVPMSVDTYVAMLAILKAGLTVMYIDPAHGPATVLGALRAYPPAAIIASRGVLLLGMLFREFRRIPCRFLIGARLRGAITICADTREAVAAGSVARDSNDTAVLSFTSGSTGKPKALERSHGILERQLATLRQLDRPAGQNGEFVAMPMFVLFNLANGVTSVLPACNLRHPGRADPALVWGQLRLERAGSMIASPALLERLARYCLGRGLQLPALRSIATGGGPVGPGLPERLRQMAPDASVVMVYGSTEAEPIAAIEAGEVSIADRQRTREGAGLLVGRPVDGCEVRIVDVTPGEMPGPLSTAAFARRWAAPGGVGEIVVSGEHVLRGYADPRDDSAHKLDVDGRRWHRTGDAGYFDALGRLWLVGRSSAAINDFRGTVYPFQVEYAVSAVHGVRRAALVERHGRRTLVIETDGSDFRASCAEAARCVARFEIDNIMTINCIPVDRRHDAKVDYPALTARLEGRFHLVRTRVAAFIARGCARLAESIRRRRLLIRQSIGGRR